jgi:hypothetical protein
MGLYGADPDELERLGVTLRRQMTAIDSVRAEVDAALSGTNWVGPARDRFEEDWRATFATTLSRLNEAFSAAGTDCSARSQELRRIMGV